MNPSPPSTGTAKIDDAEIVPKVFCPTCGMETLPGESPMLLCNGCGKPFETAAAGSPPMTPPSTEPVLRNGQKTWSVGTLTYTTAGLVALFFWLLWGDFSLEIRNRSVGAVVQLFLKRHGVGDFNLAVLTSSLPACIGMVLGPIVSYRSDRHRGRWGRRIPYLLIPTPVAALSMLAISYSREIGTWLYLATGQSLYPINMESLQFVSDHTYPSLYQAAMPVMPGQYGVIVGVFSFFWTLFEVAIIISAAVIGGLINDVVPRPLLGRFYGLFRAVSLLCGMIFNYWLIAKAEAHFREIFIGLSILFGVGFTLMCLKVKEGEYPPPDSNPHDHRSGGFFGAVAVYFRECFSKPHYLWCFAAFTLGTITFNPINLFSVPYFKALKIDAQLFGNLVASSYFVSLCLAYPLGMLVDRFHALRVGMAALILYAISSIYGALFIHDSVTFGIALVAHTVLSGTYFTASASLGQALLPRHKFGQFSSAGGLVTSVATMAIGPLMGFILDRTQHDYRLTYVAGFILSVISVAVMAEVYRRFNKLGGVKGYVAPE